MYHKTLENTFYLFKSAYKISTVIEKHFCHQILNCIKVFFLTCNPYHVPLTSLNFA